MTRRPLNPDSVGDPETMKSREPRGISGGCFWMLSALGGRATAAEIRRGMAAAGDEHTPAQVKGGLKTLAARGLAERAVPGRAGHGHPAVWGLTAHGRAMAGSWCPDGNR